MSKDKQGLWKDILKYRSWRQINKSNDVRIKSRWWKDIRDTYGENSNTN